MNTLNATTLARLNAIVTKSQNQVRLFVYDWMFQKDKLSLHFTTITLGIPFVLKKSTKQKQKTNTGIFIEIGFYPVCTHSVA